MDTEGNAGDSGSAAGNGHSAASSGSTQTGSFITYLQERKIDALMLLTRLGTIFFSIFFLIPIVGEQSSNYQKALLSTAATSALRLHQRLPRFTFTREYLGLLFLEDSAHYLFYALIFSSVQPMTLTLVPVFLLAILHCCSFLVAMCRATNRTEALFFQKASLVMNNHQANLLRMVAMTEIFVMPSTVLMLFSGKGHFFLPIIYFRFLSLRYQSRRNPYPRQMFYELRVSAEHLAGHQNCPAVVGRIVRSAIALVCRLAPQVAPQ